MNRTLLLALLSRCRKIILEELESNSGNGVHHLNTNTTSSSSLPMPIPPPSQPAVDPRTSYDNAYFYILFVMGFYSFLAIALFKSFVNSPHKKDPYEEFMGEGGGGKEKLSADDFDLNLNDNVAV